MTAKEAPVVTAVACEVIAGSRTSASPAAVTAESTCGLEQLAIDTPSAERQPRAHHARVAAGQSNELSETHPGRLCARGDRQGWERAQRRRRAPRGGLAAAQCGCDGWMLCALRIGCRGRTEPCAPSPEPEPDVKSRKNRLAIRQNTLIIRTKCSSPLCTSVSPLKNMRSKRGGALVRRSMPVTQCRLTDLGPHRAPCARSVSLCCAPSTKSAY
jgi:hypothetical protein